VESAWMLVCVTPPCGERVGESWFLCLYSVPELLELKHNRTACEEHVLYYKCKCL